MSARTCPAFAWCELDHSQPGETQDIHDQHVTVEFEGLSEQVLLSVDNGVPRMDYVLGLPQMWRVPGEEADDFLAWAGLLRAMSATYDEFVQTMPRTLKRRHEVTLELADRDA